jgi:hypothetical protein
MPFGDGTGPMGRGPMTGRGMGFCGGYDQPGSMNAGFRGFRGRGTGFGRGRGWRHWFYTTGMPGWARQQSYAPPPAATSQQEIEMVKAEASYLRSELENIEKRMSELTQEDKG